MQNGRKVMALYYDGPTARITHEVFESWCPTGQTFVIDELEYVHTVREDTIDFTSIRVCSTGLAGASVGLATMGWPVLGQPSVSLYALLGLVVFTATARATWRLRWARREVRAVYRGRVVCLFRTTDPRTFGQVTRALLRVLEHRDDAR
jgi:hypothetical protein